ncbi:6578_t:CDS:2 [Paraglomus brasilianum]|uniref:6578_t:CDS:1 n=1 Tax=Paraglomus brasilianum TaxID=144538 RepID=A0A9N9EAR6_9GLOM|nr:6578_t:CDS:2 [Paraglomus brasilianum]
MSRFEVLRNVDEAGRQLEVGNDKLDTPRIKVGSVKLQTRDYNELEKAALKIAELAWILLQVTGNSRKNTESCCLQKTTTYTYTEKCQYSLPPLSDYEAVPSKLYCTYHGECETSAVRCPSHITAPNIFCTHRLQQQHRVDRICNWYVEGERIVESSEDYVVTSRPEHTRELLVFPREHKTNKQLVKSYDFWW